MQPSIKDLFTELIKKESQKHEAQALYYEACVKTFELFEKSLKALEFYGSNSQRSEYAEKMLHDNGDLAIQVLNDLSETLKKCIA